MAELNHEDYAVRLMRAKFGGLIPEMLTAKEALELMMEFSKFEIHLTQQWEKVAQDYVNHVLPAPIYLRVEEESKP